MRILIVETDYGAFLEDLYARQPGLADASYEEQLAVRRATRFADSFANHLGALGQEAAAVYANNKSLQRAWAREHSLSGVRALAAIDTSWERSSFRPLRTLSWRVSHRRPSWLEQVLADQVRDFAPDVLVCNDVFGIDPELLSALRDSVGFTLVGQHSATPVSNVDDFRCYDLFLSSVPAIVTSLRDAGLRADLLRLCFDAAVLEEIADEPLRYDVSFVGSLFAGLQDSRIGLLERLCERFDGMRVWSASIDGLPESSPIRRSYQGPAWGLEMYRTLCRSRITVNRHVDVPGEANNGRLFEATGCGTLLVTDARPGLADLFDVGDEVVAYETDDECVELIDRYLDDERMRADIARAGQERTLRDHTYERRTRELLELVEAAHRRR